MRVRIVTTVDLGEFGPREDQIQDAEALCKAVAEAVVWHGTTRHVTALEVGEDERVGALLATFWAVPQPQLAGVEWGGR